jgi:hypothetical protein
MKDLRNISRNVASLTHEQRQDLAQKVLFGSAALQGSVRLVVREVSLAFLWLYQPLWVRIFCLMGHMRSYKHSAHQLVIAKWSKGALASKRGAQRCSGTLLTAPEIQQIFQCLPDVGNHMTPSVGPYVLAHPKSGVYSLD